MTTMNTQLGFAPEVTYGTPVTPSRFFEFNKWNVALDQARVASTGLRSGTRTPRADRFEPYTKGAGGSFEIDVPSKGFGFFLQYMLGAVSTGSVVDSNFTHTAIEGTLLGKFFTAQVNKPLHPAGTNQAHTYHGCKLTKWELACDVDGVLMFAADIDAEDEDTATALATASYPTDYRIFSFAGASLQFASGAVEPRNFKMSADLGLNVDRRFLRASPLKREQTESALWSYTWECDVEHSSLVNYDRFRSATRVGALASILATFNAPVPHGGTTLPQLTVSLPLARFDACKFDIDGPAGLMDSLSGVALSDTGSPVTITYRTTDSTP